MVTLNKSSLSLNLSSSIADQGSNSEFHYIWLRDNCKCPECCHPDTKERVLVTADIPLDIRANSAQLEGQLLSIEWSDENHKSVYDLNWLAEHAYSHRQTSNDPAAATSEQKRWGHELQGNIPTFEYGALYSDSNALLEFCCAIRDYGLTIVRDAPIQEAEIERFANHVACVRETIYDRLHNVRATPDEYNAYNVASTALELKPHTDMPNYNNPPGVQMFHFLVNDSIG